MSVDPTTQADAGRGCRRGRRSQGDLRYLTPTKGERGFSDFYVRLARDAQGQARPGAAARRDHHAGPVPADVHLSVRRGRRRIDR